jgi:pimeloyl-ACP methyl ester carboxylesterase
MAKTRSINSDKASTSLNCRHWSMAFILSIIVLSTTACSVDSAATATPQFLDESGNTIPGSIATLEKITLNGVDQWLLMRGKDVSKPVLLFLHDGPGLSNMPFVKLIQSNALEENFVVIQWDQRGTGKSFSNALDEDDMKIDKLIADVNALTHHLRARFEQEKIFLFGHGWGSDLGFMAISKHPELYQAYIATGVTPHWNKRHTLSFDWTLQQAKILKNSNAVKELKNIHPFDSVNAEHIAIKNAWLITFSGERHSEETYKNYIHHLNKSPEYSKEDIDKFIRGITLSKKTIDAEILTRDTNLFRDLPEADLPIHFFAGRYDQQTPSSLVKEYYDFLTAPEKTFTWFDNSGHSVTIEEPEKVTEALIKIVENTRSPRSGL